MDHAQRAQRETGYAEGQGRHVLKEQLQPSFAFTGGSGPARRGQEKSTIKGISGAHNFFSEAKGTRGWCGVFAALRARGHLAHPPSPVFPSEQQGAGCIRTHSAPVTLPLFAKFSIPRSSAGCEYRENHLSILKDANAGTEEETRLKQGIREAPGPVTSPSPACLMGERSFRVVLLEELRRWQAPITVAYNSLKENIKIKIRS